MYDRNDEHQAQAPGFEFINTTNPTNPSDTSSHRVCQQRWALKNVSLTIEAVNSFDIALEAVNLLHP